MWDKWETLFVFLEISTSADFYLLAVVEHQDPRQLHPGTQGNVSFIH